MTKFEISAISHGGSQAQWSTDMHTPALLNGFSSLPSISLNIEDKCSARIKVLSREENTARQSSNVYTRGVLYSWVTVISKCAGCGLLTHAKIRGVSFWNLIRTRHKMVRLMKWGVLLITSLPAQISNDKLLTNYLWTFKTFTECHDFSSTYFVVPKF